MERCNYRIIVTCLAVAFLPALAFSQPIVTMASSPGTRNLTVIYYDKDFLFLARNYGDHRDFGGSTEPGLFVHSKSHDCWLKVSQVSTKDARFGKSDSDNPGEKNRLLKSSVVWDFTSYVNKSSIELPLRTSGSIAFPDRIEYEEKADRFKMGFFSSWNIPSAETSLYLRRKDLIEQFEKIVQSRPLRGIK